ncbi:MAG: metallophosphoesterase [Candidatus Delongbacteria bacterium]|nr:metallophosphoesterase [Candidatus Delongbacteria bacterium]
MILGILSDTHDHLRRVEQAMQVFEQRHVEHILFAGDMVSPFVIDVYARSKIPVTAVYGNNEGEKVFISQKFHTIGKIYDAACSLELDGKSIFMCHYDWIAQSLIKNSSYDIIIYGHTHHIDIREISGRWLINPGEACGLLTGRATVVILDTTSMKPELIDLPEL